MQFKISSPTALAAKNPISNGDAEALDRLMNISGRIGLYGMLVGTATWGYLVFPDIGLPQLSGPPYIITITALTMVATVIAITTIGHELLHLLALPARILRSDTYLAIWPRKPRWSSTVFTKIGGQKTKIQFIWISLFPFLALTVTPFAWAAFSSTKPNLLIGLIAICNIYASAFDVAQSLLVALKTPAGSVLR
ncbi:MAG: metalloprotease family protein [Roseateles sp.]|uniref:metalloprotease family protein n=1 Tax=Roseateles sp. TaxID=1971397 RepID=UPI0039EAC701